MNQIINAKQLKYTIALLMISSIYIGGTTVKAQQDSWISIIMATIMMLPILLLYSAILKLYPCKNFFEIIIAVLGNIAGKILCCIYVFYAIHLGSMSLNYAALFVQTVNMPETPDIAIAWFMILPCIYLVYKGAKTLGNLSAILYIFLVTIFLFTVIFSFNIMKFNYIFPIMNTDFMTMLDASTNVLCLPLGEIILPLALFSFNASVNYKKILFQGIILGMIILLVANIRNLLVLGPAIKNFPFASYISVSIIAIGNFFTRFEVIIGVNILIGSFFKIGICCFAACIGLSKIFNVNDYKYFAIPVCLLMVALKCNMFTSSVEAFKFISVYKYYAIPFQFIFPVIILIVGAIKIMYAKIKAVNTLDNNQNNNQNQQAAK